MLERLTLTISTAQGKSRIMKEAATTEKKAYHHGDLRAGLLSAIRQLVEEKGPDQFSVAEAARLAGVSTAAPYKHFKDRDEMLKAAALDNMARQSTEMRDALAPLPPKCVERIEALGQLYIECATREPGMFRLTFALSSGHNRDPSLIASGKAMFGLLQHEVATFLGIDPLDPEAERRAMMLWSFVHGLSFLLIDGKVEAMELDLDLPQMLHDVAQRVMVDH